MWRRTYFLLILARIYFALSPSYLHPDENFQGPEVIAGMLSSLRKLSLHAILTQHFSRTRLLVPRSQNLGVYLRTPNPQYLSAMARIRLAHVHPALALGRLWI